MRVPLPVLAAFALGACNAVLGLDEATGPGGAAIDAPTDAGESGDDGGVDGRDADLGPDIDVDGVPDAIDNCATEFNPAQHDEEADGVGDVCDNCPHVANPGQANREQPPDDLGDLCDPAIDAPGDRLVFFDGFNGTTLDPSWNGAGTWRVEGGELRQLDANALRVIRNAHTGTTFEAAAEILTITPTDRSVSVTVDYATELDANLCVLHTLASGATELAVVTFQDGSGSVPASSGQPSPLMAGSDLVLRAVRQAGPSDFHCIGIASATGDLGVAVSPAGGGLALRTHNVTAAFAYAIVLGRDDL